MMKHILMDFCVSICDGSNKTLPCYGAYTPWAVTFPDVATCSREEGPNFAGWPKGKTVFQAVLLAVSGRHPSLRNTW